MRILLLGVSMLALAAPVVQAQAPAPTQAPAQPQAQAQAQTPAQAQAPAPRPRPPSPVAKSERVEPGVYRIFFGYASAALNADARRTIADAADEFKRTGAAQLSLAGHADLAGTDAYNTALSRRRAESVRRELVRLGVPDTAIALDAKGEADPLVPTAAGVPEPRNRRVVIRIPAAGAPAEPVVSAAGSGPEPAAGPVQAARRMLSGAEVTLGGFYGLNLVDGDDDDKESHLGGLEIGVAFNVLPSLAVSLEQAGFYSFEAQDEGFGGRSVVGVDLQGSWGAWRPYIGANFGGIYGEGIEDDLVAGPEVGVKIDTTASSFVYVKGAYDVLFDRGWDEGVAVGGIGVGWRY